MESNANLPIYFAIVFPVLFVLVWIGSCMMVSLISGWHLLAMRFASDAKPYGDVRTAGPLFYTVYTRYWTHYGSVIRMQAAQDALYLSVFALFRAGHPPLRIPWQDIRIVPINRGLRRLIALSLGNKECVSFRVGQRMARKLGLDERMMADTPSSQPPT
ncbi:MAG TPA: hypothetical protein VE291_03420 [Terracidiphilus sp.]|jgi:hypothetical protein|nr:hypothetical protein [Terracidiphilus sp.]